MVSVFRTESEVDPAGSSIRVAGAQNAATQKSAVGDGLSLTTIAPNPVRGTATIGWDLAEAGTIELALYDASGRLVATLMQGEADAGEGSATLDVAGLPSGAYHVVLRQGDERVSYVITVVK